MNLKSIPRGDHGINKQVSGAAPVSGWPLRLPRGARGGVGCRGRCAPSTLKSRYTRRPPHHSVQRKRLLTTGEHPYTFFQVQLAGTYGSQARRRNLPRVKSSPARARATNAYALFPRSGLVQASVFLESVPARRRQSGSVVSQFFKIRDQLPFSEKEKNQPLPYTGKGRFFFSKKISRLIFSPHPKN